MQGASFPTITPVTPHRSLGPIVPHIRAGITITTHKSSYSSRLLLVVRTTKPSRAASVRPAPDADAGRWADVPERLKTANKKGRSKPSAKGTSAKSTHAQKPRAQVCQKRRPLRVPEIARVQPPPQERNTEAAYAWPTSHRNVSLASKSSAAPERSAILAPSIWARLDARPQQVPTSPRPVENSVQNPLKTPTITSSHTSLIFFPPPFIPSFPQFPNTCKSVQPCAISPTLLHSRCSGVVSDDDFSTPSTALLLFRILI